MTQTHRIPSTSKQKHWDFIKNHHIFFRLKQPPQYAKVRWNDFGFAKNIFLIDVSSPQVPQVGGAGGGVLCTELDCPFTLLITQSSMLDGAVRVGILDFDGIRWVWTTFWCLVRGSRVFSNSRDFSGLVLEDYWGLEAKPGI